MSRVLLAVPTFETITPDTFKALWDMDRGGHDVIFEFVRGYDTASARNNIADKALGMGADYLMMVDSDVTVPRDALTCLMEHGKRVVTGYYMHRTKGTNATTERTNVCRIADGEGKPFFGYPAQSQMTGAELRELCRGGQTLVQIHGSGMGCVLIDVGVFHEARYPWFDWVNYPDDNRGLLSEDLYFCEQMHNECIPIYVDTRVACGHLMRRVEYV